MIVGAGRANSSSARGSFPRQCFDNQVKRRTDMGSG